MTQDEARDRIVDYWLRKAGGALQSAQSEAQAGRLDFAVNRAYYACFYAASAVLLRMGKKFVKHSGLRAAVHQDLVKAGKLDVKWGKAFDRIFENRQSADYVELWEFETDQVEEIVRDAERFVQEIRRLLAEA
ncbi:MAG TPA: HEPN domain-containing protein [Acidiferrobacterales bacterium]|nr:HEPN domain-containing protein [Acidiferrobacterales bacterium]